MIKLTNEESKLLLFFQQVTGAAARDCVADGERVVFVVANGEMGKAIGRGGGNIEKLERLLKKRVQLVEHSDDPQQFLEGILSKKISLKLEKNCATIDAQREDRGKIIGKGGEKIKLAKQLLKRHFGLEINFA